MPFKSFVDDQTILQCRYYYFHTPPKVDGQEININFENCSIGYEIKLPHMRRELSIIVISSLEL